MRALDKGARSFWYGWWKKWHRRIRCLSAATPRSLATTRHKRRTVRAIDVSAAWKRVFMPAVDPEYVMPDWWQALPREEKRITRPPGLILRPRRVRPASESPSGFSLDDVGRFLKLPDGTVYRDRRPAAHRLWRVIELAPAYRQVIEMLPGRTGRDGRLVRGRTPGPVLDALVCFGLVHAGMTQVAAAQTVLAWAKQSDRDPKKLADENRIIWRELRLPAVSA